MNKIFHLILILIILSAFPVEVFAYTSNSFEVYDNSVYEKLDNNSYEKYDNSGYNKLDNNSYQKYDNKSYQGASSNTSWSSTKSSGWQSDPIASVNTRSAAVSGSVSVGWGQGYGSGWGYDNSYGWDSYYDPLYYSGYSGGPEIVGSGGSTGWNSPLIETSYDNFTYTPYQGGPEILGSGESSGWGGSYIAFADQLRVECIISDTTIEEGDRVTIEVEIDGGNSPYDIEWDGDVDEIDDFDDNDRSQRVTIDDSGTYRLEVEVRDDDGNRDTDTCTIRVRDEDDDDRDINVTTNDLDNPDGQLAGLSSVYLNQVPYTGPEDTAKVLGFISLILIWSSAVAYYLLKDRKKKQFTNRIQAFKEANKLNQNI